MKTPLAWEPVSREALTAHLEAREVLGAQAVGETLLYRCQDGDGETLALALPGGQGLIIRALPPRLPEKERRKAAANNAREASKEGAASLNWRP